MASYVVNPSKKVAEILSQFLEFDPKQLQIGIWSGDLSISDVNLKRDAFAPFLNPPSVLDDDAVSKLHLKLVSGKVGNMRVQIPWKRLVWGEGAVRLYVSDVDIVLAYESRDETRKRLDFRTKLGSRVYFDGRDEAAEVKEISDQERERKQKWLQEAEKRQLQGLSIPSSYDELYKCEKDLDTEALGVEEKEATRVDSYLRKLMSSMMWRFVAGLQASFRNVRVVLVQDGIEVGVIFNSTEVLAGKQTATTVATEPTASDATDIGNTVAGSASENEPSTTTGPLDDINEYEGEYTDGEHVDKTINIQGLGVFVRQVPLHTPATPLHLEYSHSVNPDDYILKPTSITLSLKFFYPHPPDKQRKKKVKERAIAPAIQTKSTSSATSSGSVLTTETAKARRGKREKEKLATDVVTAALPSKRAKNLLGDSWEAPSGDVLQPFVQGEDKDRMAPTSTSLPFERLQSTSTSKEKPNSLVPPMAEFSGGGPSFGSPRRVPEGRSISFGTKETNSIPDMPSFATGVSPHLELEISLGEVKAVYSSRHYHYSMTVLRSMQRMRRGRPSENIKDHLNGDAKEPIRSIFVDTPIVSKRKSIESIERESGVECVEVNDFGSPSPSFAHFIQSPSMMSPTTPPVLARYTSLPHYQTQQVELKLNIAPNDNRQKKRVVMNWWEYAYKNVLLEVRARRKKRAAFDPYSFHFDWNALKHRRREYINLYLRQSAAFATFALRGRNDDETMRLIEDDLNVEQILLYRSIARALHVRGINEMGDTVIGLHDVRYLQAVRNSRSSSTQPRAGVKWKYRRESTGEYAVNEFTSEAMIDSLPSGKDAVSIDTLRHASTVARSHRDNASRSTSATGPNQNCAKQVPLPPFARHESTGFPSDTSSRKTGNLNTTSRSGGSDARTFKTTVSSFKKTHAAEMTSSSVKRTGSLRFSLTFRLNLFSLLVLNDEPFARSLEQLLDDGTSTLHADRSQDLQPEDDDAPSLNDDMSSDDVSYLTDDGNFPEPSSFEQDVAEEMESGPLLSTEDFLTFCKPTGVVLDFSIASLNLFCGGLSGGVKKIAFGVGTVSVVGEGNCNLLTAGSTISNDFQEFFSMQEISVVKNRKQSLGQRLSTGGEREAIRACFLLMQNQENFLEVDLAKIVVSAELEAVAAVQRFSKTIVTFPRPLIANNELDILRECLLNRSNGAQVWQGVDCALRCHGFDVVIPSASVEGSDTLRVSARAKRGGLVRASVTFVEFYSGSLVEQIYLSSCEHQDTFSRFSGSKSTGYASGQPFPLAQNLDRGLKLLDICHIYDQQRSMNADHAVSTTLSHAQNIRTLTCLSLLCSVDCQHFRNARIG